MSIFFSQTIFVWRIIGVGDVLHLHQIEIGYIFEIEACSVNVVN